MNISIEAAPEEIAALVLELQERRESSNARQVAEPEETDCDINIMEFPGETEHPGKVRVWFGMTSLGWYSLQESVGWKLFLKELALAQKL